MEAGRDVPASLPARLSSLLSPASQLTPHPGSQPNIVITNYTSLDEIKLPQNELKTFRIIPSILNKTG